MSLVTIAVVAAYTGVDVADTGQIAIHNAVEEWLSSECGRNLESADYVERRDGNGTGYLTLWNNPVTLISQLSIGRRTGLSIKHTSGASKSTLAIVQVTDTNLRLKVEGGTNEHTWAEYDLASYTIEELAAAVTETGWTLTLGSSSYADIDSTNLYQVIGASALDCTLYLYMPEAPESQYEVYPDGTIWLEDNIFISGYRNILIEYTAGYTSSTCPDDLSGAILMMCKYLVQTKAGSAEGLKSYSLGDISKTFRDAPEYSLMISGVINKYTAKLI